MERWAEFAGFSSSVPASVPQASLLRLWHQSTYKKLQVATPLSNRHSSFSAIHEWLLSHSSYKNKMFLARNSGKHSLTTSFLSAPAWCRERGNQFWWLLLPMIAHLAAFLMTLKSHLWGGEYRGFLGGVLPKSVHTFLNGSHSPLAEHVCGM